MRGNVQRTSIDLQGGSAPSNFLVLAVLRMEAIEAKTPRLMRGYYTYLESFVHLQRPDDVHGNGGEEEIRGDTPRALEVGVDDDLMQCRAFSGKHVLLELRHWIALDPTQVDEGYREQDIADGDEPQRVTNLPVGGL